jgi:hypothetical protein
MIGPVSGTGRAMMASLQQAMSKGMPPDQAIQYVKGMATQGVAPLADLYAMMNQFQRLKQQQVQPPQTPPTIKDQLNMADQQQQMQAQQGGIAGMQAPPPAGQPMDRGLGAIDAGRMEYPQFAGGGIVAFARGGNEGLDSEEDFSDMGYGAARARLTALIKEAEDAGQIERAAQLRMQRDKLSGGVRQAGYLSEGARRSMGLPVETSEPTTPAQPVAPAVSQSAVPTDGAANPFSFDQNLAEAKINPFGQVIRQEPPAQQIVPTIRPEQKPAAERRPTGPKTDRFSQFEMERPDLAEIRREREERQKATKTGAYSQADADLAAYIKEQKDQGADQKQAYRNFWVMTGASLMANKSPYFLSALGESVRDNYGGLVKDLKGLKDDAKQLRLQEIQLRRAQEQAMESGSREDQQRYDSLLNDFRNTNYGIEKARSDIEQKVLERNHETALANLRAGGQYDMADMATKLWFSAEGETDPAKKKALLDQYQRTLGAATEITRATTAGGAGAASREEIAVANAVQKRKEQSDYKRNERVYFSDSATPEEKAAAKARMDEMERKAATDAASILGISTSGSSGYVPSIGSGTGGGPYSTSGW